MSIIQGVAAGGGIDTGDPITRSLRFNSADSANLSRAQTSGNRQKFAISCWLKPNTTAAYLPILTVGPATLDGLYIYADNVSANLWIVFDNPTYTLKTTQLFRDPTAHLHFYVEVDTTQATAANRVRMWVNGSEVTSWATANYPPLNYNTQFNQNTVTAYWGRQSNFTVYGNMNLSMPAIVDGSLPGVTAFGRFSADTGAWVPKTPSGITWGTNGFLLTFSDNSGTTSTTLGKDTSGNSNNWTPNNFSVAAGVGNDSLTDTPTNNYCTLNPLDSVAGMLSNGNLDYSGSAGGNENVAGSMSFDIVADKVWFEVTMTTLQGYVGILAESASGIVSGAVNGAFYSCYVGAGGAAHLKSSSYGTAVAYSATTTTAGEVLGVRCGNGEVEFYKDGVSLGVAYSGLTGRFKPWGMRPAGGTQSYNFGQRAFAYTPPTGFKSLCTANMTIPTILKGANHFNVVTYTGTGSSLTPSAGFAFQPNLTWIKGRSGATDHAIYDAVRGVQKQIESNTTTDETTESTGLTAWTSSSFTVGTLAQVNTNAATYVAWNWKANGAGASNSVGTITATVSANTTAGVSIATYTGTGANATVGHGLGVAPSMVIVKARTTASTDQGWAVYHSSLTSAAYYILLSSNGAQTSDATVWNSTAPTSTVFSIGTNALTNTNADTYVAYCFASITGFSAIGSYIGNGSSDGPFVYLGFRPRYVMIKNTAATGDWRLQDAVRNPYNVMTYRLWASTSAAEDSSNLIDFLANGFKIRADSSSGETNSSGVTYIYIAFAETPFNFSNAR